MSKSLVRSGSRWHVQFQQTERMNGTENGVGLTAPRRVPHVPVKMA